MKRPLLLKLVCSLALAGTAACGQNAVQEDAAPNEVREALSKPPVEISVETPEVNARRGRLQFITRGCVICHQVNGVGGRAAPDLSAMSHSDRINPLDFSARMWRGAPAMTALQAVELGYVIDLDAQDIADLAAFAASPEEQKLLTLESVPAEMRDWFIDVPHWSSEDWTEYLQRGERIPGLEEEEL
ncbi:c-type cytochrome [Hyphococcus sp.]|jgi:cytochrome c553|uniref:c-type cytochrome n=1 Tax=Hyphococcus sp. TaxID=2038636 RepID=UPI003D0A2262